MTTCSADQTEDGHPFPVDISKIEASDSVQSHLSTSTSSKRLRLHLNAMPDGSPKIPKSDVHIHNAPGCEDHSWIQTMLTYPQMPFLYDISYIPTSVPIHPTQQERRWVSTIVLWAAILYCVVSCSIASFHLYTRIREPDHGEMVAPALNLEGECFFWRFYFPL